MKRFLLIAACAFLSLGFLSSCQKEEASVLSLAKDLTAELKTITDHKSAEEAAPRVAALNKRFQKALARPFAGNMEGSALLRSCDGDAPEQEGALLTEALRDLAKEVGRVQASLPVEKWSDEEVSVPRLKLSVGANNGSKYEDATNARYATAQKHMQGEEERNAVPYPDATPICYGSEALTQALDLDSNKVAPYTIDFFQFDGEADVVATPASVNPKAEDAGESDDAGASSGDSDDETPSVGGDDDDDTPSIGGDDDETPSGDDDTPSVGGDDDDDGGLPSLDDDDSGSDDSSDDDGGMDLDIDI